MKLNSSIILGALVAMTSGAAVANPVWDLYTGLSIGAGAETVFGGEDKKTSAAQSFGGILGIDLPAFRIEGEYNYLHQSDTHANLAFFNAYFKMPSTVVKPYLGLGVGWVFDGKNDKYNIDFESTAAYQGMLGVTLDTPALPFKFDIEARTVYMPDIYKIEADNTTPDVLHYEARIKARYIF